MLFPERRFSKRFMNFTDFKLIKHKFLKSALKPGSIKIIELLLSALDRTFPDPGQPIIEIGFESRNLFKKIKILIIGMPIHPRTFNCFKLFFKEANSYDPDLFFACREFEKIFKRLLNKKQILKERNLHFSFELSGGKINLIKLYFFGPVFGKNSVFFKIHPILKKYARYYNQWLLNKRICFGIEYNIHKLIPDLKVYLEFLAESDTEVLSLKEMLPGINSENLSSEAFRKLTKSAINSDRVAKLGLRFKGKQIENKTAKFYLSMKNTVTKNLRRYNFCGFYFNKKWMCDIEQAVSMINGHCSYLCFGSDGFEVYIR